MSTISAEAPPPFASSHLEVLLSVARDVAGTLDRSTILHRVQERIAEALGATVVMTLYWDSATSGFRAVAHRGLPDEIIAAIDRLTFPTYEPFRERSLAGETLVTSSLDDWPEPTRTLLQTHGARSLISAPLVVGGTNLGRLVVVHSERDFDEQDRRLAEGVALHLALALEAADLYSAKTQEAVVQSALANLGRQLVAAAEMSVILDRLNRACLTLLGCDYALTLLDDAEQPGLRLAAEVGRPFERDPGLPVCLPNAIVRPLWRELADTGVLNLHLQDARDPLSCRFAAAGAARAVYIGLTYADRIIGIQVALYRESSAFPAAHRRIAAGIGPMGSYAIGRARLIDELARANRLKSEFVATMSHELRSPLNVILGYNDLLLDGVFGPLQPEQADTLERMQRRAWELLELINTTLDMSRLAAGQVTVDLADVEVAVLVEGIAREFHESHDKPSVQLGFRCDGATPRFIRSDGPKLKVILRNLLRNAIKFTDAGRVDLEVEREGDGVRFSVCDTGIGIDPSQHEAVFEAFRQADGSTTRRHGGAGIGLYAVRQLALLLGGKVNLSSAPGCGTTVRLWLPLEAETRAS